MQHKFSNSTVRLVGQNRFILFAPTAARSNKKKKNFCAICVPFALFALKKVHQKTNPTY